MYLPARNCLRSSCLAAFIAILGVGCGGINASHSVSPASFFLPGLLKADPPQRPADPPASEPIPAKEIAQLR